MEVLYDVAAAWHRRACEELERDLVLRCSEVGSAPRVVARELTGASVDLQAPVRAYLIEDCPVQLHDLVSEGARAGVEDGFCLGPSLALGVPALDRGKRASAEGPPWGIVVCRVL